MHVLHLQASWEARRTFPGIKLRVLGETVCIGLLPKGLLCSSRAAQLRACIWSLSAQWPFSSPFASMRLALLLRRRLNGPRADLQFGSTIYSCFHDNLQVAAYNFYPQANQNQKRSSCFSLTKTQGISTLSVYFSLKHSYKSPNK